jgi:hypothetical protein
MVKKTVRIAGFGVVVAAALVVAALLVLSTFPAYAQVKEPTGDFELNQVEVYRHVLETNDQLFLITATVEYTTPPSLLIEDTFLARIMDGATERGQSTFYGKENNGYVYGLTSIYFPAASALTWSGAYDIDLLGNPSLQWLDDIAVTAMAGALAYDAPVYTDETAAANSAAANDMTLLPAVPAVGDAYYFGSNGMFDILTVNVGQNGNWTGTYTWEYWDGDEWKQPSGLTDNSTGFTAGTGAYDITFTCPEDWQKTTVSGSTLYWLRFRVVTYSAIVTQPLGTQSWTNTLATPPARHTSTLQWLDEGNVTDAQSRLTARLRALAWTFENDWGGTTDLIETLADRWVLTEDGEDYFVSSIDNLRLMCPDLFAEVLETPDFDEDALVLDMYAGSNTDSDTYGVDWYAQTFTAQSAYSLMGFELKLFRVGTPGNITVSVRDTAGGVPAGADVQAATISGNTFTTNTDGEWHEFVFNSAYPLNFNSTYAVVVRATAGNANNYVGWRLDSAGGFGNGQACSSGDSGVTWAAMAGTQDFTFGARGLEVQTLSYREKLATRLVGTRFDMTDLAASFGLTRMWASGLVWLIICTIIPTALFVRATGTYKGATLLFLFLTALGAFTGFLYLEVPIVAAFLCGLVVLYSIFFRGSP